MLVLTRHVGEALVIDGGIRVVVLALNGNKVRLGFEAPAAVSVLRGEVFLRETAARAAADGPVARVAAAGGII